MTLSEIYERIFRGSMPRLYENPDVDRFQYYESYLETYISRDIRDLFQVADETSFLNFMSAVAARTATNVNYETLANEVGISSPTAKHWLSVLVSSGIVALIQPYSNNALKRVIKAPRMYFLDTGLCAHLTKWSSAETLEAGAMGGEFFETWVISEIYKSYLNAGQRPPLHFYRDSNKKEIDVILYQDGTVTPVEIKKGSAPKNAVKNFSVLTGTDDILFPALAAGCDGSMTAFASVFPDDVCAIYGFMDLKQEEKARAVQERLLPLLRKADALPFPKGYKLAMQEASGIAFGDKEDE